MKDEVFIRGILCRYKEYRLKNGHWILTSDSVFDSNSEFIENMVNSSSYFATLGGSMSIEHKQNRRFGLVPSKIVCVSICGAIKKVFMFNYNQAQVLN